ncbi:MAG: hypothetical protein IJW51_08340 [Clostridia bacterium]|nr:hypothetical protein [Clostridia bacterium]
MKREQHAFPRVLSRFSRLIYHIIAVSFIGKLFTSYTVCNEAVVGHSRLLGGKRERIYTTRRYTLRRAIACAMEQNLLSRIIRGLLLALALCSLRTFGFFFTVMGATWTLLYGVSLFVSLGGAVTWVHLISGAISLTVGVILFFSDQSFGYLLHRGSLLGFLLFRVLGVPDDMVKEMPVKGEAHYLIASAMALFVAALGLLVAPFSLLQIACSAAVILVVLSVPEAGFLLALFVLPFSGLLVGSDMLTVVFLILMVVGYVGKFLRGNRSFSIELQDLPMLVFIAIFLLSCSTVARESVWEAVLIEVLLAVSYLIAVNILSTPNWMHAARVSLSLSAVLAAGVGVGQLLFAWITAGRPALSTLPTFSSAITAGFENEVVFAFYLVVAIAFLLPQVPLTAKKHRALPVLAILLVSGVLILTFVSVAWLCLALIFVCFLLIYEYRSLLGILFAGGAATGALFLIPQSWRNVFFGVFRDITDPAVIAARAGGRGVISRMFFSGGEGFFSQRNGIWRFVFGGGHRSLATLHPYFALNSVVFSYSAYNLWQVLLAEYGVVGLALVAIFFLLLFQNCFSVLAMSGEREHPLFAYIGIVFAAAVIFFGSFHYTWYNRGALALFFLAAALICAAMRYHRRRGHASASKQEEYGAPWAETEYSVRAPRAKKQ